MHKDDQINPYRTAAAAPAWALTRKQFFNLMTVKVWVGGDLITKKNGDKVKTLRVPVYKVAGKPKELFHWQIAWDKCGREHFNIIRAQIERSHSLSYLSADNFCEYQKTWERLILSEEWANFRRDGT